MRHAQPAPNPVGASPIAMVQPALGARLMAAAGGPETLRTTGAAAGRAAEGMAPIAGPAEEEWPLTPAARADAEERHRGSGAARSELIAEIQRVGRSEAYDEPAMPGRDSEAVDFRAAAEFCASLQRFRRWNLETMPFVVAPPLSTWVPWAAMLL